MLPHDPLWGPYHISLQSQVAVPSISFYQPGEIQLWIAPLARLPHTSSEGKSETTRPILSKDTVQWYSQGWQISSSATGSTKAQFVNGDLSSCLSQLGKKLIINIAFETSKKQIRCFFHVWNPQRFRYPVGWFIQVAPGNVCQLRKFPSFIFVHVLRSSTICYLITHRHHHNEIKYI